MRLLMDPSNLDATEETDLNRQDEIKSRFDRFNRFNRLITELAASWPMQSPATLCRLKRFVSIA